MCYNLQCSSVHTRTDTTRDTTVKMDLQRWSNATIEATISNKMEAVPDRTGTEAMIMTREAPQLGVAVVEGGRITRARTTGRITESSIITITAIINRIETWEQIENYRRDS